MTVKFWTGYSKPKCSTAIPSASEGVSVECTPCNPINILSPYIKMTPGTRYSYAYIPDYGRYYYVNDIVYRNGYAEYALIVDVMASYRAHIKATTAYVARCADSSKYNNALNDALYPTEAVVNRLVSNGDAPFNADRDSYIVQCESKQGLKTLWMTAPSLQYVVNALWQEWGEDPGAGNSLMELMGTPTDNIKSIRRCALNINAYSSLPTTTVSVGIVDTTANAYDVTRRHIHTSGWVTVPKPDGYTSRPSLLYNAQYSMWIPGCGIVSLPSGVLYGIEKVYVSFDCAMDTGKMLVTVSADNKTLVECTGVFTCDYGVSFQSINLPQVIGAATGAASGLLTMGLTGNPIGLASSVASGLQALNPTYGTVGSNGDWFKMESAMQIYCNYQNLAGEDITNKGRPCCKRLTLGSLTGYVKCDNPQFAYAELTRENDLVNAYLTEGAYIV